MALTRAQQSEFDRFLRNNPGDRGRASEALGFDTTGAQVWSANDDPGNWDVAAARGEEAPGVQDMIDRDRGSWERSLREAGGSLYDPSDLEGVIRAVSHSSNVGRNPRDFIDAQRRTYRERAGKTPGGGVSSGDGGGHGGGDGGGGGGGSPRDDALATLSQVYNDARGGADNGMREFLAFLTAQQTGQQRQQADVRRILMEQLGTASTPVDVNDPRLRAQFVPQQQALQRSAERKRSQLAARLSRDNLLDSGTFDTGLTSIEEQRGQGEAQVLSDLLGRETSAKRQQLQSLLQMAIASGDAEAARNISAQLQGLGLEQNESQFGRSLAQNESQFGSRLGFDYDALGQSGAFQMAGLNQAAILALLGAI